MDHVWKAEHPSLFHLEASTCCNERTVWCLDSNEYSGVNDRYFIMEREGASVMESFVDILDSFKKLEEVNQFARARTTSSAATPLNFERFLLQFLRYSGLCIRYMTAVSGHAVWPERLSFAFAEVWHQGGTWDVSSEPFLRVARCGHVPAHCGPAENLQGCLVAGEPFFATAFWTKSLLVSHFANLRCAYLAWPKNFRATPRPCT